MYSYKKVLKIGDSFITDSDVFYITGIKINSKTREINHNTKFKLYNLLFHPKGYLDVILISEEGFIFDINAKDIIFLKLEDGTLLSANNDESYIDYCLIKDDRIIKRFPLDCKIKNISYKRFFLNKHIETGSIYFINDKNVTISHPSKKGFDFKLKTIPLRCLMDIGNIERIL